MLLFDSGRRDSYQLINRIVIMENTIGVLFSPCNAGLWEMFAFQCILFNILTDMTWLYYSWRERNKVTESLHLLLQSSRSIPIIKVWHNSCNQLASIETKRLFPFSDIRIAFLHINPTKITLTINSGLMTILQFSSSVFLSWTFLNFILIIHMCIHTHTHTHMRTHIYDRYIYTYIYMTFNPKILNIFVTSSKEGLELYFQLL